MYIDYSTWEFFEYKISTLVLDASNPRLRYKARSENLNQTQIMKILIKEEKVYELAKKISEEGYFVGEEPIICLENNKKVVLEGNRRTAALKLLLEPKKYLSTAKSNILMRNILQNNIRIDELKIKCYIAPNRLQANPIIYERHKGEAVHKWKTGNQYSFVGEMYLTDGLSIDQICEVLNEKRGTVLKTLKTSNLFYEGQEILEKEGTTIDISNFDITNLERFYLYENARNFLGIDFDNDTGDIIIKLPQEEFEKRMLLSFRSLMDAERFSRAFNKEADKKKYLDVLMKNPTIDLSIIPEQNGATKSKVSENRTNLEEQKNTIHRRRRNSKNSFYSNHIIPRDKEIIFDNEKLDALFIELKNLPIDKKYSFAILLRSFLEQSLFFYIDKKNLAQPVNINSRALKERTSKQKIEHLINYIQKNHNITEDINGEELAKILNFTPSKEFSESSLKANLDYIVNQRLKDTLESSQFKNTKSYINRIKMDLDLAVHNLHTVIDSEHNKRAWQHLEPVFNYMVETINETDPS